MSKVQNNPQCNKKLEYFLTCANMNISRKTISDII